MPAIPPGSVADRILRLLAERGSATEEAVVAALRLRPSEVALELRRLSARGLVLVERPGGGTAYATLTPAGAKALGAKAPPPPPPRPDDDPAFL